VNKSKYWIYADGKKREIEYICRVLTNRAGFKKELNTLFGFCGLPSAKFIEGFLFNDLYNKNKN